ncbi:putative nodulin homeobox protein [Helianthus anomalus]
MQPNDEVYRLFHLCASSIQFIQSLCKHMLFRERLAENKELCGGGAILQLVQNTLKLPEHDDPLLASVVDRIKSEVLSIVSPIMCRHYLHK